MSSIFVSIANYKDTETINTVNELLSKSSGQNQLHICVLSQIDLADKVYDILDLISNVTHLKVNYLETEGLGWARSEIQKFYQDEDFYLQFDSHMLVEPNWDLLMIEQYNMALKFCEKPIISIHPTGYEFDSNGNRYIPAPTALKFLISINDGLPSAVALPIEDTEVPQEQLYLAGGFQFTAGNFVKEVPHDLEIFFGEEMTLAIRAYTAGYRMFAPTKHICAHLYNFKRNNEELTGRTLLWDEQEDAKRKIKWWMRVQSSRIKIYSICLGKWFGRYGIQDYDLYVQFKDKLKEQHNVNLEDVTL
jgi:hypothetical protein